MYMKSSIICYVHLYKVLKARVLLYVLKHTTTLSLFLILLHNTSVGMSVIFVIRKLQNLN